MGIKNLQKLIDTVCPQAVDKTQREAFHGKVVAVDASTLIYRFITVARTSDGQQLMNEKGQVTSHIQGIISRLIQFNAIGVKAVWVFDGSAPELKKDELDKRRAAKESAEERVEEARETGNKEMMMKLLKRTSRMTDEQIKGAQRLLRILGQPVVESPGEGESQCAALCKAGLVSGVASEDRDTLTFGSPLLLVNFLAAQSAGLPVLALHLDRILEGLELTMSQFVDLCILLGCDYCAAPKGVGYVTAYRLIRKHGSLEAFLASNARDSKRVELPEGFADVSRAAKREFEKPSVADPAEVQKELKWKSPDIEGFKGFMTEMNFDNARVARMIERLALSKKQKTQIRLDSFVQFEAPKSVDKAKIDAILRKQKTKGGRETKRKGIR